MSLRVQLLLPALLCWIASAILADLFPGTVILIGMSIGVLFVLGGWLYLGRSVTAPLQQMEAEVERITREAHLGNLRARPSLVGLHGEYTQILSAVEKLQSLLLNNIDNFPVVAMNVDRDHTIRFINRVGANMLGLKHEEMEGRKCYDMLKTDQCKTGNCVCRRAMDEDRPILGQCRSQTPKGERRLSAKGIPLKNEHGDIVGAISLAMDQTDVLQSQERMQSVAAYQQQEVDELSRTLEAVAQGNMRSRYRSTKAQEGAEDVAENFGAISLSLNHSLDSLSTVLNQIVDNSATLAGAAEELTATSGSMGQNMNWLGGTVEQLTGSFHEIVHCAETGEEVSQQAIGLTNSAGNSIERLEHAAEQIDQVTTMIKRIAQQTNMLALNATIEAASAGSAGKGFAVVAGEIKNLARQSAEAAEVIAQQIDEVQGSAREVIMVISSVVDTIHNISDSVTTISRAAHTQTRSTDGSRSNLERLNEIAQDAATGSRQVMSAAEDLSRIANALDGASHRFSV